MFDLEALVNIIIGILEQGFIFAVMALGIYITYKILDFPDLSADGTFPLGGAVTASLIVAGVSPVLTLFISFIAGAAAGILTGIIHVKFKVRDLLSGIIMMTALYSVNLRIAGSANVPIYTKSTIFENTFFNTFIPGALKKYIIVILLFIIVAVVKKLLDLYLNTKSGYLLRAVGDNDKLVTSLAKDKGMVKIIGLAIANALVALSGSIYVQKSGYFDISTGTGTMVMGLASVIIGMNIFRKRAFRNKNIRKNACARDTAAVVIGSVIYKACIAAAIAVGLEPQDMKLITSILFLGILIFSIERKRKVKTNA